MAMRPSPAMRPLLLVALLAAAAPALAEPPSGRYGPLALAIRDGMVHGVFAEGRLGNGTDEAPQFSCLFLLKGRLTGDQAAVETWFPGEDERIAGLLRLDEPSLQLDANHGGCSMTSGDMTAEPYRLLLDERHDEWIGAGLVTAERAVLRREAAEDPARTQPYLVALDAIAMLERRDDWIRVEYLGGSGPPVVGWMREDELATTPADRR